MTRLDFRSMIRHAPPHALTRAASRGLEGSGGSNGGSDMTVSPPAKALAFLALALAAAPDWGATAWSTDSAASTLTFVATQAGGEFEGTFRRFEPMIVFDAADLAHSRFADATGKLTLRNVTHEIHLPFTFKLAADGKSAVLVGGTAVHRLDFGVGQGEWSDTKWVGDEVRIRFELTLRRTPP